MKKKKKSIDSINYSLGSSDSIKELLYFSKCYFWYSFNWSKKNDFNALTKDFIYTEAPPKRDFIRENVKNLKLMQQYNQNVSQANKSNEFEKERPQQRKIRSTSHSRLCSSTKSAKNTVTSKSIENGKKPDGERTISPHYDTINIDV